MSFKPSAGTAWWRCCRSGAWVRSWVPPPMSGNSPPFFSLSPKKQKGRLSPALLHGLFKESGPVREKTPGGWGAEIPKTSLVGPGREATGVTLTSFWGVSLTELGQNCDLCFVLLHAV